MKIPHYSELPAELKSAINLAHYSGTLCPQKDKIFHAFYTHRLQDTRVVILGQDPYHTPGKANGLAFGYNSRFAGKPDASLRNIIKECTDSHGSFCGDISLESWARQGVLLLNTKLTTIEGKPNAHKNLGWEQVVTTFLQELNKECRNTVWLLWGADAHSFSHLIDTTKHLVIKTTHPSPFSAYKPAGDVPAFIGSDCFSEANDYLERRGRGCIDW